jgi:Icc-related predicted phosphoesterase
VLQSLFLPAVDVADVLVLCGDLTDRGLPEEAVALVKELAPVTHRIPTVGVLGNHDYEAGHEAALEHILEDGGITILNGEAIELLGLGFAGVKGFVGGFEERALQPWGEKVLKALVEESVQESVRLEKALARLRTDRRVVLLHYSPIRGTLEGEPLEIFPYLGSSRLEDPIDRYHVSAVFHGHAHRGAPEGRTRQGVPVYNVALPLLRKRDLSFFVLDIPRGGSS